MKEEPSHTHVYDISRNYLETKVSEQIENRKMEFIQGIEYVDLSDRIRLILILIFWGIILTVLAIIITFYNSINPVLSIALIVSMSLFLLISICYIQPVLPKNAKKLIISSYGISLSHPAGKVKFTFHWNELEGIYKMGYSDRHKTRFKRYPKKEKWAFIYPQSYAQRIALIRPGQSIYIFEFDSLLINEIYEFSMLLWKRAMEVNSTRKSRHYLPISDIPMNPEYYSRFPRQRDSRIKSKVIFVTMITLKEISTLIFIIFAIFAGS